MAIMKAGQLIRSLDDWERLAPPKKPAHWVDGRSAKEVARAWLEGGGVNLPDEVHAALTTHQMFGSVLAWEAEPEAKLAFDEFPGETRNSDLSVIARDDFGSYVLAVEAKADESFGETIAAALAKALERRIANPDSNGIARIESLARLLLRPRTGCAPKATDLRYQLLTACAGAVAEAGRRGVERAVMLVHEFISDSTLDVNHQRNANDLAQFVTRIAEHPPESITRGRLYGPFDLINVSRVKLFVGKVARHIRYRDAERESVDAPRGRLDDDTANMFTVSNQTCGRQPLALQTLIDQIRNAPRTSQEKNSNTVSSNVSSGFKKATGEDYKSHYDDDLRRAIAELGTTAGVQVSLLVKITVLLKSESPSAKRKFIDELTTVTGNRI